jgi:hypothetical protein
LFCSIWIRGSISGNISDDNKDDAGDDDYLVLLSFSRRGTTQVLPPRPPTAWETGLSMTCQRAPAQNLGDVRVDVKEVEGGKPSAISVIVRGGNNLTGNDFAD